MSLTPFKQLKLFSAFRPQYEHHQIPVQIANSLGNNPGSAGETFYVLSIALAILCAPWAVVRRHGNANRCFRRACVSRVSGRRGRKVCTGDSLTLLGPRRENMTIISDDYTYDRCVIGGWNRMVPELQCKESYGSGPTRTAGRSRSLYIDG